MNDLFLKRKILRFLVANYLSKRKRMPKFLASLAFGVNKILFWKSRKEKIEDYENQEHELNVSALNFLAFIVLFLIILICNLVIWLLITG